MMAKKVFIISGIVFVSLLVVFAVVTLLNREDAPQAVTPQNPPAPETPNSTEPDSSAKIRKVIEGKIDGAVLNGTQTKILFYQDKRFLETDFDGTSKNSIGAYNFAEVKSVVWAPDKNKAVVQANDGFHVYLLDQESATKLKEGVDVVAWSKMGDKIIYKYYDSSTKERSINIADVDGNNWKELLKLQYAKVELKVHPGTGDIFYYQSPDSFSAGELSAVGFSGENVRKVTDAKYGADFLWSPNGKKLLMSFVTEQGGRRSDLGVMNDKGGEYTGLNFPSVAKKCAWSNDNITLYCAMMGDFPTDANLPNDWASKKYFSTDTFWKINTQDAKKTRLVEISDINEALDSEELFLDKEEKFLFFTERKTGSLYRIKL